jgi:hypothetical protein
MAKPPSKKPAAKKPAAKKPAAAKAAKGVSSEASQLLAHFPPLPPKPPETGVHLPKGGQPGSWDDIFDKLPAEPATPPLATSYWSDGKQIVVRFEPDGKLTFGGSGGVFSQHLWRQRGPWLLLIQEVPDRSLRSNETLLRVEGDVMAGYARSMYGVEPCEYRRSEAVAEVDEYIRAFRACYAWSAGPRDTPQAVKPTWHARIARWGAPPPPSQATGPLRFANHRAARALTAMKPAERKHLAAYKDTLDQQAEFGGIEAIDLLDGKTVAYHLYWWPFTDGILVDAKTGEVVADLLDGTLTIEDAGLRARTEAACKIAGPQPTMRVR